MNPDWIKPAVFGNQFYSGNPYVLREELASLEDEALSESDGIERDIVGIVTPHAGYAYSGPVAAKAYAAAMRSEPDTIVVFGLSHRVRISGVSVLEATGVATPLGAIEVDGEFIAKLADRLPDMHYQPEAHLAEHSVETQYPFIHQTFPKARVVEILTQDYRLPLPVRVGQTVGNVARELSRKVLVVASTDLSHFPPKSLADEIDGITMERMLHMDPEEVLRLIEEVESRSWKGLECAVCSKASFLCGLAAARELGADAAVKIAYANSGDRPGGDLSRVVGYGAMAWYREETGSL